MAKILFLREGPGKDRVASQRDIPVEAVLERIGVRKPEFRTSELPVLPAAKSDLTAVRDPAYVVVQVTPKEVQDAFNRPGYYLLRDVTPAEARRW